MTIRLGILDAVPTEFYVADEKTDPEKFIAMFRGIGAPMSFSTYAVTQGDMPKHLDECDAYLITGSPCSVYESLDWIPPMEALIREIYASGVPLVGICFGHQLIAQSLGRTVRRAKNSWLLGLTPFNILESKPWMRPASSQLSLYFINQDQVVELPRGVELLAGSSDCPIAAFGVDRKLLTIQGHPEQPLSSMHAFTKLLLEQGLLNDFTADSAHESMAAGKPDADTIARWIEGFLGSALAPMRVKLPLR